MALADPEREPPKTALAYTKHEAPKTALVNPEHESPKMMLAYPEHEPRKMTLADPKHEPPKTALADPEHEPRAGTTRFLFFLPSPSFFPFSLSSRCDCCGNKLRSTVIPSCVSYKHEGGTLLSNSCHLFSNAPTM